jgi:hypothetical protein
VNYSSLSKNTHPDAIKIIKRMSEEDPDELDWYSIYGNPEAIELIEQKIEEGVGDLVLYWEYIFKNSKAIKIIQDNLTRMNDIPSRSDITCSLSENSGAIDVLKANPNFIQWYFLSSNPGAIEMLKANQDKINWSRLSRNPAAINILKVNTNKIYWEELSENPGIFINIRRKLINSTIDELFRY